MALNSQTRDSATTMVRGLSITINLELISKVENLPLGVQCIKEDKSSSVIAKKSFFTSDEKWIEDKNGVKRESLPYP